LAACARTCALILRTPAELRVGTGPSRCLTKQCAGKGAGFQRVQLPLGNWFLYLVAWTLSTPEPVFVSTSVYANYQQCYPFRIVNVNCINPILNVSDIAKSFAWFEKWGWKKLWDWGTPPTFGAVGSGECAIFLCQGCQGGRGKGENTSTFGPNGDEESDQGV
jgi:hypothetical protein